MKDAMTLFEQGLKEWHLLLNPAQRERFERLTELLLYWNKRINLTTITEPERISVEQDLDSVAPLAFGLIKPNMSVVDVGTGAGFPGLPLAILCPQTSFTLVDATRKKVDYLKMVCDELSLTNVKVIWARAEKLSHEQGYRETFDCAVARAFGALDVVLECTVPFVKVGSIVIAYKGPRVDGELAFGERAARLLGGQIEAVYQFRLPCSELTRSLVVVRKTAPTPSRFPRRPGVPERRPLRCLTS